jgi:hypothetical protein
MFSWFDLGNDLADKTQSFVTVAGEHTAKVTLVLLFVVNVLLGVYGIIELQDIAYPVVLMLMNLTLLFIMVFRRRFVSHDSYRLLGDAVFLFPFVTFLINP